VDSLRGRYEQRPPAYSAKKVGGRRAYEMAREEQPVELQPVPVNVSSVEILGFTGDRVTVTLTCSAGFYVRTFAHELGQRVGTGACLEELRRTRSGDFTLDGAATLDALGDDADDVTGWLVELDNLLPSVPAVRLTDEGRLRVSHGRVVESTHMATVAQQGGAERHNGTAAGWTRLLDEHGHLIALGQAGDLPGSLHPAVVLI
jgi:tRNA pseudouridine55 synthase